MQLLISSLTGSSTLDVGSCDTIASVRQKLNTAYGDYDYRLVHNKTELSNNSVTLEECNVVDRSTLHVIPRVRGGAIQVFIKPLASAPLTMHLSMDSTILSLKQHIQDIQGVPIEYQRLVCMNGTHLTLDDRSLYDYRIAHDDTIYLHLSLQGGSTASDAGMKSSQRLDEAFFESLFPNKDLNKRKQWLQVLLDEEFEYLTDIVSLNESAWNSLNIPLAVKEALKNAATGQIALANTPPPPPAYDSHSSVSLTPPPPGVGVVVDGPANTPTDSSPPVSQLDCIVIDISSSMKARSSIDALKTREDISKLLFHIMVDKLVGLELSHALGLIAFGEHIERVSITREYERFHDHLGRLDARQHSTKLWDSIYDAAVFLKEYAKTHSHELEKKKDNDPSSGCVLRVFVLTDGEDNASKQSPWHVAQFLQDSHIILDAIPLAGDCSTLQAMTTATGGLCLRVTTEEQACALFERQAVLHCAYRERVDQSLPKITDMISLIALQDKTKVVEDVRAAVPSALKSSVLSADDVAKKVQAAMSAASSSSSSSSASSSSSSGVGAAAFRRIMKEYTEFQIAPAPGWSIYITSEDFLFWKAVLIGPPHTLYAGGTFMVSVRFPPDYPFKPPKVHFVTPIYHCNISNDGGLCLDILKDNWSPALTISKLLLSISSLLSDPNADDALDAFKAQLYRSDRSRYEREAQEHTIRFAGLPLDQLLAKYNIDQPQAIASKSDPASAAATAPSK